MDSTKDFAVAVWVETPDGVVVVEDPTKPSPIFQKFPGGHGESGETPRQAVARELEEETGVAILPESLEQIYSKSRRNHIFFLFRAEVDCLTNLGKKGNDGEVVSVVPRNTIFTNTFLPAHRRIADQFLE